MGATTTNTTNGGTTAGSMTSVYQLDPTQQYLLNQQNAAKSSLTNGLAGAVKQVNSNYASDPEDTRSPLEKSWDEAYSLLGKVNFGGDYTAANNAIDKAYDNYDLMTNAIDPALRNYDLQNSRLWSIVQDNQKVSDLAANIYMQRMRQGVPISDEAYRKQVQDALMEYQESRLNPTYKQQANALATRLANQGITQGSTTYNTEWDNYNRAKNDAYQAAYNQAIALGEEAINNQFQRDMANYQQVANDYLQTQGLTNDAAAKWSSGVNQAQSEVNNAYRLVNDAMNMINTSTGNLHNVYSADAQQKAALNNAAINLMAQGNNNKQLANNTRQQQLDELQTLLQLTQPTTGIDMLQNQNTAGNIAASDQIGAVTGIYGGSSAAAANGAAAAQAADQSSSDFLGDAIGAAASFAFK